MVSQYRFWSILLGRLYGLSKINPVMENITLITDDNYDNEFDLVVIFLINFY